MSPASPPTPTFPSSTTTPQILLLGAGELGLALLPHLLCLPHAPRITLGTHTPTKHTSLTLASPSLSLLRIDLSALSATLAVTFSHYDIIISATGFTASPPSVLKLAHEILAAGGLRAQRGEAAVWYFPWQWGVDYDVTGDGAGLMPLFGAQKGVRDLLRAKATESNVCWTIVSTGIFMSFLFERFWGIVDRSAEEGEGRVVVRCLRDWGHGVTVTHVGDIGRVVERILKGEVEAKDRVVYVAGDTVRYGEVAEVVRRLVAERQDREKTRVEQETWSMEYLEEELHKDPENGIKKYRVVFAREGVWWDKTKTVNHELGMDMMSVEDYARELFSNEGAREKT